MTEGTRNSAALKMAQSPQDFRFRFRFRCRNRNRKNHEVRPRTTRCIPGLTQVRRLGLSLSETIARHGSTCQRPATPRLSINPTEHSRRQWQRHRSRSTSLFRDCRGSALECAAIQDTLEVCEVLDGSESKDGKAMLIRIVSMLTKLGRRDGCVRESPGEYGGYDYDNDYDNENGRDSDNGSRQGRAGNA